MNREFWQAPRSPWKGLRFRLGRCRATQLSLCESWSFSCSWFKGGAYMRLTLVTANNYQPTQALQWSLEASTDLLVANVSSLVREGRSVSSDKPGSYTNRHPRRYGSA